MTFAIDDRIVIDPNICHGKPVIRGTRVPVTVVIGSLAGGITFAALRFLIDANLRPTAT
jgi:uncharacterized protein (DUF433 family)